MEIQRKLATIDVVSNIRPIENADNIVCVQIRGWECVSLKDQFQIGDKCVYFEIDSFLPIREEFEFLRKSSYRKMGEFEGFRLKTIRLRNQISQGLVIPLSDFSFIKETEVGTDLTEILGVLKWDPPLSANISGNVKGYFPSFIHKTDEERIQNLLNKYKNFRNDIFTVTEKLDGTSFTCYRKDNDFGVCGRNYEFKDDSDNAHWEIVKHYDLINKLKRNLAIQGELVGPGIQKNSYKLQVYDVYVFSIQDLDTNKYLSYSEIKEITSELGLKTVPIVSEEFILPENTLDLLALANGNSLLNKNNIREGLVFCNKNKSISFKIISNQWLIKND